MVLEQQRLTMPPWGEVMVRDIYVHNEEDCKAPCAIHAPSDHALKNAVMTFRTEKSWLIERQCEHGAGHPDPDSMANIIRMFPEKAEWIGVHGCDGCCGI